MAAERRTGPRDRGKEIPWHQRARAVLKDVPGGPLTVEDIVNFFANHDPSPVQTSLLNQFTDEELDLSRRVMEGELNLEAAVDQLREMFQRMPSSRRPPGGPPGGQPQ